MGAASATLLLGAYQPLVSPFVIAAILDSPFTSFRGLVKAQARHKKIPLFLRHPVLFILSRAIRKRCEFELQHIAPIAAAKVIKETKAKICQSCRRAKKADPGLAFSYPVLVLSATGDLIVPADMSGELYENFNIPKMRIVFPGDHNSPRPPEVFRAIVSLLGGVMEASALAAASSSAARATMMQGILDATAISGVKITFLCIKLSMFNVYDVNFQ
jgi:hypothetical protein